MPLMLKFKLKGGILIESEMLAAEVARWINAHELEERIQVFRDIDLNYDNEANLKKVFVKISEDLVNTELSESENFILLTTLEKLSKKVKENIKNLNK